jgi:hypothetical protein
LRALVALVALVAAVVFGAMVVTRMGVDKGGTAALAPRTDSLGGTAGVEPARSRLDAGARRSLSVPPPVRHSHPGGTTSTSAKEFDPGTAHLEKSLEMQLELASREYLGARSRIAGRRIREGLAYYSSANAADAGLAIPHRGPDIDYVFVTDSSGKHLVELRRDEYPELFALKDLREELRGRMQLEAEDPESQPFIPSSAQSR